MKYIVVRRAWKYKKKVATGGDKPGRVLTLEKQNPFL